MLVRFRPKFHKKFTGWVNSNSWESMNVGFLFCFLFCFGARTIKYKCWFYTLACKIQDGNIILYAKLIFMLKVNRRNAIWLEHLTWPLNQILSIAAGMLQDFLSSQDDVPVANQVPPRSSLVSTGVVSVQSQLWWCSFQELQLSWAGCCYLRQQRCCHWGTFNAYTSPSVRSESGSSGV